MDQIAEYPSLPSKEALPSPLAEIRRGSQRIWDGFWQSPVQQRIARHLIVLGLVSAAAFIQAEGRAPKIAPFQAAASVETTAPFEAQTVVQAKPEKVNPAQKSEEKLAESIFAGLTVQERQKTEEAIGKQLKLYQNDKLRIKNTLQWAEMMEMIVNDKRLNIQGSEKTFWKQRMLEIIFVESEGNPKASSGLAYGLTQLKPSTAKEAAQRLGIAKYDLYNGWDNAFLGLAHQRNLAERYGPDLGAWTHHLGSGNMDLALKTYLIQVKKLPVKDVDLTMASELIKKYQITPFVLLKEPAVTAALKYAGAFGDQTQEYFKRIIASGKAMGFDKS